MIGSLQHVALRVADVREATDRWAVQFGLTERGPGLLSCDDEPCALELIEEVSAGVAKFRVFARAVGLASETTTRVAARLIEVRRDFGGAHASTQRTPKKPSPRRHVKR